MSIFNSIIKAGPSVLMPIIFFLIAVPLGIKIGKAFKAALLIGIGFTGLTMSINLLLDQLGPATKAMVERLGVHLTDVDTGWAVASTIGWGSSIMPIGVLMFLLINIIFFVFKISKTIDIDIFNYWIFLLVGSLIYAATDNFWLSLILMGLLFATLLVVADKMAPKIQKVYQVEGLSFPHVTNIAWMPFGMFTNFVLDRIPKLNKLEISPKKINERFGVLGEPMTIGFILGVLIGLLAGYNISKLVLLAVDVSATMVLIPKMVDILMEGLLIVREGIEAKLKKKYPDREILIGMDIALLSGDPAILATGLLLIPITLLLAVVLPGNKVLPFVDLPSLFLLLPLVGACCRKDIFRMLISGTLMAVFMLYFATDLAPVYTTAARMSNVSIPGGFDKIISLNNGGVSPLGWIAVKIGQLINSLF